MCVLEGVESVASAGNSSFDWESRDAQEMCDITQLLQKQRAPCCGGIMHCRLVAQGDASLLFVVLIRQELEMEQLNQDAARNAISALTFRAPAAAP